MLSPSRSLEVIRQSHHTSFRYHHDVARHQFSIVCIESGAVPPKPVTLSAKKPSARFASPGVDSGLGRPGQAASKIAVCIDRPFKFAKPLPISTPGMAVRQFLRTNWRGVTIGVTALVIFCGAILLLSTMPPRAIAMATGPEGSGYEEIGRQYQSALERAGVQVRLVATAGSLENLALTILDVPAQCLRARARG
jgi:hypothetical protein